MLKKRLLPLFLCLALLMSLAACQKNDSYKLIESPLKDLEWGMAWDDVFEVIQLTENEQANIDDTTTSVSIDYKVLGENFWEQPLASSYEEPGWCGASLQFVKNEQGERYLSGITLMLITEYDSLIKLLDEKYGEAHMLAEDYPVWSDIDPKKEMDSKTYDALPEAVKSSIGGVDPRTGVIPEYRAYPYVSLFDRGQTEDNVYSIVFKADAYVLNTLNKA